MNTNYTEHISRRNFLGAAAATLWTGLTVHSTMAEPPQDNRVRPWNLDRFTFLTDGYKKRPWEEVFPLIAAGGFRQVEVRAMEPQFSMNPGSELVEKVAELARQSRVSITGLNSYLGPRGGHDAKDVHAQIAAAKRNLEAAKRFGARTCRVLPPKSRTADSYSELAPFLRGALPDAERVGVALVVETNGGVEHDPVAMRDYCVKIGSPFFGLLFNPVRMAERGVDYKLAWEVMRPHVRHVHLSDFKMSAGKPVWAELGEGEMDLGWMIAQLKNSRYEGLVGLEFDHHEASIANVEQWRHVCEGLIAA